MADDDLTQLLESGWEVAGYSVCALTSGLLSHNVLLKNGHRLQSVNILIEAGKEVSRVLSTIAPAPEPPKKKGFFG